LHNQDWEQAEIYFRSVLEADRANPECHMGLAQALQRQGRMDEARVVQERSVILSRIRVDMSAIQESADALKAIEELAEACQQLQWPEAEAAFKQHAQRIMVPAN
jgi:tetratricopeptide (TPR) repeat protein